MSMNTPQPARTQRPSGFPQETFIGFFEKSFGESQIHGSTENPVSGMLASGATLEIRGQPDPISIVQALLPDRKCWSGKEAGIIPQNQ